MKKKQTMDVLVIGFALFSMFFGAGNLIFPPKLGLQTGQDWAIGFTIFTIADAGLALVAILATIRGTGELDGITRRVGRLPSMLLGISVFLCVGPLMAIPRTAASTFELGAGPVFRTDARVLFAVAFFLLVFVLSVRPSKVIDIIGKFLTPALYVSLLVLIFVIIALTHVCREQDANVPFFAGLSNRALGYIARTVYTDGPSGPQA